MILITVEQLITDYSKYRDKYIFVGGEYDGILLRGTNGRGIVVDSGYRVHSTIDLLLRKIKREQFRGMMCVVGKVGTAMTPMLNIGQVLKVELLDDVGKVIDTVKVGESSIPKELRGKI